MIMMGEREKAIEGIIQKLLAGERKLDRIKADAAKRHRLKDMVRNSEILSRLEAMDTELGTGHRNRFLSMLRKRPMRTLSGVTPIAVMVRPEGSCLYSCIYCPTGIGAKSYTGYEPAALRARQENFDPCRQVANRLAHYTECGHPTDKCEIIVMGGTFLQMPDEYKQQFIKGIFDGLNGKAGTGLMQAKLDNENARHRAVGLTIETRPDVCGKKEIGEMLEYGATRVELGVQHPDDAIYITINRGHAVRDVVSATALLKDSAFKVCYHIMPGLPGSDMGRDILMVKKLFSDPCFQPDMLKIYPTLVMPGTGLEKMMDGGGYRPYSSEESAEVISEFFRHIPCYARVMRIMRDIPAQYIGSGATKSNLRELVDKKIREKGIRAKEIRSREVGLLGKGFVQESFEINRTGYGASGGKEIFLSMENRDGLIAGFLRLRIPHAPFRMEITQSTSLVRELHVYGSEAGIGLEGAVQHKGIGAALLDSAERISKEEFGSEKIIVISGIVAKEYYRKLGYSDDGPYMSKAL